MNPINTEGLPLFAVPEVRTMARPTDPPESKAAAVKAQGFASQLQLSVWLAYRNHGPMTAKEAEALPEFAPYGFSTVRKRVSELRARGRLAPTGITRDGSMECQAV